MSKKVDDNVSFDSITLNQWRFETILPMPVQEYDDIVDDSDYKPTAERIRDNDFRGGAGGVTDEGLYDYEAKKPIKEKVSDIELLLRNGKLDKADVQRLNDSLDEQLTAQAKESRDKKLLEASEQASKNRTKALDEALGVNQQDKGKVSS